MAGFGGFLTHVFFFTTGRRKELKDDFNTSIIFDVISNYTNYIHIFITCLLFPTEYYFAADLSTG